MNELLDFLLALASGALVWMLWGTLMSELGLLDMFPEDALRATFSIKFWRTGEL